MCGPYKSSFKVLEGGSRAGSGVFPEKLSTLPAAAPAEYHIMSHLDYSPQVSSAGNCFIVWFSFRETCQSSFETSASVSLFLQLLVLFCVFFLCQRLKQLLYRLSLVGFTDIINITSLIDTVGKPKVVHQLSVSPKGCWLWKRNRKPR